MRTARITLSIGIWLLALGTSLPAQALDPDIRCEAGKMREAGRYQSCLTRAQARAIKGSTNLAADIAKCEARYRSKWTRIESRAGGSCPSNADEDSIQSRLLGRHGDLTTLLSGGVVVDSLDLPATGQTTCWAFAGDFSCPGSGQDGEIQAGAPLSYQDNEDGTITDLNTGLMWEKLSNDGTIHDHDTGYSWESAFAVKVAALNSTAFAGHTDWRVPNMKELFSIVNYDTELIDDINPHITVSPVFNSGCVPGCAVTTCSCTGDNHIYWSSTSTPGSAGSSALVILFHDEGLIESRSIHPTVLRSVRAVRGP